jgi:L-asparaginase
VRLVALVFTGGTISMRHDSVSGGAVPSLGASEIVDAARGIEDIAALEVDEWGRYPGPHMSLERVWALRNHLRTLVARDDVDGVVVTHGTDTLEESAYLATRSIDTEKPIVFTGAMRTASDLGWDGPANLVDAVRVASSDEARGYGSLVVLNSRIFAGLDVTKAHTHLLDAFESPGLGPVGVIDDGAVIFRRALPSPPPILSPDSLGAPVDIVLAYAGCDARAIDAVRGSARGLVVAALGRGNIPPPMAEGVARCLEAGLPVVIASRAWRGRVGETYGYEGGGRRLADLGAILGGARRAQQARIDLLLGIGLGLSMDGLRQLFLS